MIRRLAKRLRLCAYTGVAALLLPWCLMLCAVPALAQGEVPMAPVEMALDGIAPAESASTAPVPTPAPVPTMGPCHDLEAWLSPAPGETSAEPADTAVDCLHCDTQPDSAGSTLTLPLFLPGSPVTGYSLSYLSHTLVLTSSGSDPPPASPPLYLLHAVFLI